MSKISDRLKELGVKVGARDLPPPRAAPANSLDAVLGGQEILTHFGPTYLVETYFLSYEAKDDTSFQINDPLDAIANWANDDRIRNLPSNEIAFLDTETTGLSGGTGTYGFLIGVGRIVKDRFHLAQFFMRDPEEEAGQMAALEEFLAPCNGLVTFNGKSFDLPLLNTRFISRGWIPPFRDLPHIDLLHLARRLWRARLPSCTLTSLEYNILGTVRTIEDVPGWMIPQMYFDYLRNGDAQPLKSVFYHNAMDVVSMAALLNDIAKTLSDPLSNQLKSPVDLVSMAKHFEELNDLELSASLYLKSLEADLPEDILRDTLFRLALIHKRLGKVDAAIPLWEQATHHKSLHAHIELAKYYEHNQKNYSAAIVWTELALQMVSEIGYSLYEAEYWQTELAHRLARLQRRKS